MRAILLNKENSITLGGQNVQFIEKKSGYIEGTEVYTGLMVHVSSGYIVVVKMFEVGCQKYLMTFVGIKWFH